jgi:hypothetical protein
MDYVKIGYKKDECSFVWTFGFPLSNKADCVRVWINYLDKGNLRIAWNNHETTTNCKQMKCSIVKRTEQLSN